MQSIQEIISDDEIKKKFTELRQELGNKLKYTVDELCEIYYELLKNGYFINGFLGSGTEGPVFSVINVNEGNQIAIKVLSAEDASKIDDQLKIMKKFQNQPYIHQYLSSFYSKNNKYFFYLTEKLTCDLEQIMSVMEDKQQKFSYNQIIAFAVQMVTALSILEANKVIHSDLKPANILYDKNNKCFKMSDYGFSKIILQKIQQQSISATKSLNGGNLKYAAPEVLEKNSDYTCKIDIYGLGLILLELGCGGELSVLQIMQVLGGANSIAKYLNQDKQYGPLNTIIQSMLVVNRQNRISASDLLQKLKSLQSEQESRLYSDISGYLKTRVDEITLQNMEQSLKQLKQIYSSSLTQINIDCIKDITRQIKFDSPPLKKVNNNYGNNIIITNQQQFQEVQQQSQLSYQLNNYFSGTNNGYQQQNNFMPPWQQQQPQQQQYQQPQYNQQQFQQFSSNQLNNYNQLQYQQQSNSNAKDIIIKYQPLSYTQPIQQQYLNQQQIIQPILEKQHKQLKFKEQIKTVKELTEVEEALAKYQNDSSVSLDVRLQFSGWASKDRGKVNELTKLGASVVASRLASGLEKCSLNITSLILELEYLKIGPEGASSLATAIKKCSKNLLVVGLRFAHCNIGPDEIKYLSQSLEKCDKMTTLGLHLHGRQNPLYDLSSDGSFLSSDDSFMSSDDDTIDPTGASHLASSLTEFTLNLYNQNISNEGLQSLGSGLSKCEKLTRLNVQIWDYCIDKKSIEEFGSSLARCPNLITLSVQFCSDNYLTYAITPSLTLCKQLTTLTLLLGRQDVENISTLQTNLNKCYNLTSLCLYLQSDFLSCWNLGDTVSLVESLEESNLTTLKLIFNCVNSGGQYQQQEANRLGESLSKFEKLAGLYLFFDQSKDNPTSFISTLLSNHHLAQNKNITTLSLGISISGFAYRVYQLTSSDSKMIGESLEKCKYLKKLNLYLWWNRIKSEGALAISQSLSKCVHLTALDLSIIESYCCDNWEHKHIYIDSVSSTITNDLKKCKNLGELKVKVRSSRNNEYGVYVGRKMLIKLGILTKFESNFL